jgi:hypothetical protein
MVAAVAAGARATRALIPATLRPVPRDGRSVVELRVGIREQRYRRLVVEAMVVVGEDQLHREVRARRAQRIVVGRPHRDQAPRDVRGMHWTDAHHAGRCADLLASLEALTGPEGVTTTSGDLREPLLPYVRVVRTP